MADLSRFVNAKEYSRRNMAHANAVGAHANAKAALARLLAMKRPPMWLVGALEGIERRTAIVHPEVAAWRDCAPDNPYRATPPTGDGGAGDGKK
jgi:hypothetical protein